MQTLTTAAAVVEIRNASYTVEPIPAGPSGIAAVRLVKQSTGQSYDVIRTRQNVITCSCPDYLDRHEGTAGLCKHGKAMVANGGLRTEDAGLRTQDSGRRTQRVSALSPESSVLSPSPREPITLADRKRASYFGLKLPAEPVPVPTEVSAAREPSPARPTHQPRFQPDLDDDAARLGYELGSRGISARGPAEWPASRRGIFDAAWDEGQRDLLEETQEHEEWLDQAYAALPEREYAEAIEAIGCIAARL
jgi:hypothetical protein